MEQGAVPDMSRAGRQRRPTVQGRAGDVRLNRTANQVEWNRLPTLRFPVRLPTESLRADGARCASSERPDAPDRDQQAKAQSAAQQHIGFHFVPLKTWQRRRQHQRTRSKAGRVSSALSVGAIRRSANTTRCSFQNACAIDGLIACTLPVRAADDPPCRNAPDFQIIRDAAMSTNCRATILGDILSLSGRISPMPAIAGSSI